MKCLLLSLLACAIPALGGEFTGNGRERLTFTGSNPGRETLVIDLPAGRIFAAGEDRVLLLRSARVTLAPGATAAAMLQTVALSSKNACTERAFAPTEQSAPALAPLLRLAAERADLSQAAAQLLALALLEDIAFAPWQVFLAPQRTREAASLPHPAPAEVALAIDVLGLLRALAPERHFALAADAELKLRALRNPASRARAVQLYGPDVVALPPDIGQLLHLRPGDDCPVCRQRARMQSPPDL